MLCAADAHSPHYFILYLVKVWKNYTDLSVLGTNKLKKYIEQRNNKKLNLSTVCRVNNI